MKKCETCGKQDDTLKRINTGSGHETVLCVECRKASVRFSEKLDRVKDLKTIEDSLSEIIKAVPNEKDQLPRQELVSEVQWFKDNLFELRKDIQERKETVRKPESDSE